MTRPLRSPAARFAAFALLAVVLPAAILAILGYHSLRQWERSAETLFRAQARDMASMTAEKLDMILRATEDEIASRLQGVLTDGQPRHERLRAFLDSTPLLKGVSVFDRRGRLRYPPLGQPVDPAAFPALSRAFPPEAWDKRALRHLALQGQIILIGIPAGAAGGEAVLAALPLNTETLRREVLATTLGPLEGPAIPAVLDDQGHLVYARASLEHANSITRVPLGGTLPDWQLALYHAPGTAPWDAVRRQVVLFSAAFGLLLLVIGAGLGATYRLVHRETEMAELKADFVANVSHDLKTPLALIRMFGETLEMGRVEDKAARQEYYRVITRESERLSRLLENVLDFSRIERGRRTYTLTPVAVAPIIHETLDAFAYILSQQHFSVEAVVAPDLPDVPMDADAVGQALTNLIDNAIKYSGERRVLRVEAAPRDGYVTVAVADEGVGIPAEEQERIFEKFYRPGRSETQGRRGSGVGLALVRHIVEAHSGRVTVESRLGQGSRFTLWFPLRAGAPAGASDTPGTT